MSLATLANYADLVDALSLSGGWLHRTDTATIAPVLIQMAETTINYGDLDVLGVRGLRTGDQETTATLSTVASTQTVSLPTDFLEMRKAYITYNGVREELVERPITPLSVEERAVLTSVPRMYSVVGSKLYLTPIPNAVYTITIDYYAKVGPLTSTNTTNWLLTKSPQTYLGGCVVHAAPWMGPNFNPAPWAAMFKQGMGQVARADATARNRLTTLRSEVAGTMRTPFNILIGT